MAAVGQASRKCHSERSSFKRMSDATEIQANAVENVKSTSRLHTKQSNQKFFTAITPNQICGAQVQLQKPRQAAQHLIACGMPVGVIHHLEVVDVNHGH